MTKKDYELFALVINKKQPKNWSEKISYGLLVEIVAEVLCIDNGSFNYNKFKEACLTGKHIRKSIKGGC